MSPPPAIRLSGDRTGILLVHGFAGSLMDFQPLAHDLHRQGWTVHGVWLAGHGTSERDLAEKSASDWVLSLRRGLLELQPVADRLVLIGNSFGGNLALHAALTGPPIIGVVCLGTPVAFRHDLWIRTILPLAQRIKPFRRKHWVQDRVEHLEKRSYLKIPLRAFSEVITFIDRHTKRELPGVTVPVLVVQSKRDFEVEPDSAHFLIEHLGSSRQELVWVDERVHHVLSSKAQGPVRERIIQFIQSLPGVT